MMNTKIPITNYFAQSKQMAVLIDPDKLNREKLDLIIQNANEAEADFFFIGGSLLFNSLDEYVCHIKESSDIPVVIFPGNAMQFSIHADAILFISLVSGRNPEYLIGHHVISAPQIKKSGLEVLPTAYILIENSGRTSVEYMSNTIPVPSDKTEIVVATAIAAEMLGLRYTYLEAGSGSSTHIREEIIRQVSQEVNTPVIVGGGIRSRNQAESVFKAGADLIVAGNAIEENPKLIKEICSVR